MHAHCSIQGENETLNQTEFGGTFLKLKFHMEMCRSGSTYSDRFGAFGSLICFRFLPRPKTTPFGGT